MEFVAQQTMNALSFGAEYALLALGLAIVFSIMGLVNFAHGEIIAVGGYTMVAMAALSLNNPFIVIGAAILVASIGSVTLERVAFRPVRYADPTTGLLTAFGVSIVLQNLFLLLVSPRPIAVTSLYFLEWPISFAGLRISSLQLFETLTTIIVIVVMMLFLKKTVLGLAMRAAAMDFEMVRLTGIRANRVFAAAFLISGLLAGIACVFIMVYATFNKSWRFLYKIGEISYTLYLAHLAGFCSNWFLTFEKSFEFRKNSINEMALQKIPLMNIKGVLRS